MEFVQVVSVENMRKSDARTIAEHTPSAELMYRAAQGIFNSAKFVGRVAIVCGKGNNGKTPIDDLDGACQAHDTCYAWGGNNEKCNQEFRQRLLTIMQETSLFDYKHIVAVAAYKLFGG